MKPNSAPMSITLAQELEQAARDAPEHVFLRMAEGDFSFRQVNELANQAAAKLVELGVQAHDRVSLLLPNGPEFVVLWLGLAKCGAVCAPINTSFRGEGLAHAVNLVNSRLLIVHDSLLDVARAHRALWTHIACIAVVGPQAAERAAPSERTLQVMQVGPTYAPVEPPALQASDLCLLLYTSGTTGRSKAVRMSQRFVLAQADGVIEGLGLRADDVLYCPYPLFHLDAAVMTIAPALRLRCTAAIGARFSASRYWDEVRAFRATVFDFMGATLTMLWKRPPSAQDRDHAVRLGWGVPLPEWAPDFEQRFGCRLVELYGSTEVGTIIYTPLDQPRRLGSCGKLGRHWMAELHDAFDQPVATGQVGELVVRPAQAEMITQGYEGMPEASLAAFRNLWFHTGDLMRRDRDGYYYYVGRNKDMVRRRGENISAAEVEMGLEAHPEVLEAAVFGVPSDMTEEDVMACVRMRHGSNTNAAELAAFCERHMAAFMVPRYIRLMAELPKTPTDKIEKFRLKDIGVTADTWDRETKEHP